MAWLKKDTRLRGHPKLVACADDLDLKPVYLEGHLDSFWLACLERHEDGDISKISNTQIAILAEYNTKHADRFVQLLQKHRWLDGHLIHDWLDYVGDYLKRKYRKSPDKLLAIYRKHGRESELQKKDTSGTRTGHVPDTSGTTQDIDIDQETTETHTPACVRDGVDGEGTGGDPPTGQPPNIPDEVFSYAVNVLGWLTPDVPLKAMLLDYPSDWLVPAMKRMAEQSSNKRTSAYLRGILREFAKNGGPPDDSPSAGRHAPRTNPAAARGRAREEADFSDVETGTRL